MGRREPLPPLARPAPQEDISGEVTVVLPPRGAGRVRPWLAWPIALPTWIGGRTWLPLRGRRPIGGSWLTRGVLLWALIPVTAGVLVASRLRPEGAARVNASVLSYVSPAASEGSAPSPTAYRPASSAILAESAVASVKTNPAPRCELPVVSVWELPVARAEPPLSPWPVYHAPDAEPSSSVVDPPAPKRAPKPARPRAHRSIDDLVRRVNAADSKKKY